MMAIPAMKFIMDVVLHLPYGVAGAEESCAMRFFSVLLSLLVCIFILSGCSPEPQLLQPTDSLLNEIESVSYQFSELLPGMTKDEVMKALSHLGGRYSCRYRFYERKNSFSDFCAAKCFFGL